MRRNLSYLYSSDCHGLAAVVAAVLGVAFAVGAVAAVVAGDGTAAGKELVAERLVSSHNEDR